MNKLRIINFLVKLNFYHFYIDFKHYFSTYLIRIIGETEIFKNKISILNPTKIDFFIDRESFGESVLDFTNTLSNIKKFISDLNKNNMKHINIYIIGNILNKDLDYWFHENINSLVKNYLIEKRKINSNLFHFYLNNDKFISLSYRKKHPFLFRKQSYINYRVGHIGSYTNRFDIFHNYKTLLNDENFITLESICKKNFSIKIEGLIRKILSKKIAVFYDYDIAIRKDRFSDNAKNQLKNNLYLRYLDNEIINETLNFLIKKDYNIVRLGRSRKKFPFDNDNFYDLAYEYNDSIEIESFDFYFPYNSDLCITLGSGGHSCPMLFGVPVFNVGYHRLDNLQNLRNSMIVPKKFYSSNKKALIPLSKLQKMEIYPYSKLYWDSKKIIINSPSNLEVKQSFLEFYYYLNKIKNFADIDELKINNWQKLYLKNNYEYKKLQKSKFKHKDKFSVVVSKYEIDKYSSFYLG